jgi:hypothetical protein
MQKLLAESRLLKKRHDELVRNTSRSNENSRNALPEQLRRNRLMPGNGCLWKMVSSATSAILLRKLCPNPSRFREARALLSKGTVMGIEKIAIMKPRRRFGEKVSPCAPQSSAVVQPL